MACMTEIPYSIVEARAKLGAIAREEMRALAEYREQQARGESLGIPHEEAF